MRKREKQSDSLCQPRIVSIYLYISLMLKENGKGVND
jgi:hypothetical protein